MGKKALGCYHDTYLATDVLLLADVFETFQDTCLKNYKLDPAHFYTAPGLAWQTLLRTAAESCEHKKRHKECEVCPDKFRLELLTDIDMLLMVEKGIRGGITQAVKRYAKANDNYMNDLTIPMKRAYIFNTWMQTTFTDGKWFKIYQHMDLNGRMEKTLPLKKLTNLSKKDKGGYLLEVDVKYPKELHENHNELPFLAEKMKIKRVEKLVSNRKCKKRYVVHIKALDQALKHGLKLKKVHRVIKFQQRKWM